MPWSWEEVRNELGEGDQTLGEQDPLIGSFDFVEQHLGHEWVREQHRSGALYTMVMGRKQTVGQSHWSGHFWGERVDAMGRQLKALQGSGGLEAVLNRIREGDVAARSELFSAYLCMPEDLSACVEFGVDAKVDERSVNMDFRIRRGAESWVTLRSCLPNSRRMQSL